MLLVLQLRLLDCRLILDSPPPQVPKLLKCAAEPVTVTVETPNGKATSIATYTVLPNQSGGFC